MDLTQFDYTLPEELIAQYPLPERTASRLLNVTHEGRLEALGFEALAKLIKPGDLLVVNDTRVIPARVLAKKPTGGKVEIMLERVLDERTALVMLGANKPIRLGQVLQIGYEQIQARVIDREGNFFVLRFEVDAQGVFESSGAIPIPPYIQRSAEELDESRYQTVYSKTSGAVAAPTAGLHFDEPFIDVLKSKGVDFASVTLHVGAGTFQPVRVQTITDHVMHKERIVVDESVCHDIHRTKKNGGRVIAVGTTVVRALESAALYSPASDATSKIEPFQGESDLFIYPGFEFRVVDALVTNFHLPKSTLLMMVSAFAGYDRVMAAYQFAVEARFRFFSYGDAMFLQKS